MPLRGWFVVYKMGPDIINLCTKF